MRIIVGITGASGAVYGLRLVEQLKLLEVETHLVLSDWVGAKLSEPGGIMTAGTSFTLNETSFRVGFNPL